MDVDGGRFALWGREERDRVAQGLTFGRRDDEKSTL